MTAVPSSLYTRGACRPDAATGASNDGFFPDSGHDAGIAAAWCRRSGCPVLVECREYAIEAREIGVWGGTTETDRRIIRRDRLAATRPGADGEPQLSTTCRRGHDDWKVDKRGFRWCRVCAAARSSHHRAKAASR